MFSNSIKKALVVCTVALTVPVLGAGTAFADDERGKGKNTGSSASSSDSSSNGKGSETDKSGSSANGEADFQGKGSSTPDQDGKGMDRGADNNDKTGPGTDGNNGCGNEPRAAAPRDGGRPTEDDNNGWCGGKPKPERNSTPAKDNGVKGSNQAPTKAPAKDDVKGSNTAPTRTDDTKTTPATPVTVPTTLVVANGTVTPITGTPAAQPVQLAGLLDGMVKGQSTGASVLVAGPVNASGASAALTGGAALGAAAPTALPFTGTPVALLSLLAGLALVGGASLVLIGRRRTV